MVLPSSAFDPSWPWEEHCAATAQHPQGPTLTQPTASFLLHLFRSLLKNVHDFPRSFWHIPSLVINISMPGKHIIKSHDSRSVMTVEALFTHVSMVFSMNDLVYLDPLVSTVKLYSKEFVKADQANCTPSWRCYSYVIIIFIWGSLLSVAFRCVGSFMASWLLYYDGNLSNWVELTKPYKRAWVWKLMISIWNESDLVVEARSLCESHKKTREARPLSKASVEYKQQVRRGNYSLAVLAPEYRIQNAQTKPLTRRRERLPHDPPDTRLTILEQNGHQIIKRWPIQSPKTMPTPTLFHHFKSSFTSQRPSLLVISLQITPAVRVFMYVWLCVWYCCCTRTSGAVVEGAGCF